MRFQSRRLLQVIAFMLILSVAMVAAVDLAFAQSMRELQRQVDQLAKMFGAGQYNQIVSISPRLDGLLRQRVGDTYDYGRFLNIWASATANMGDNRRSVELYTRSMAIFQRLKGEKSQEVAICLSNLGTSAKMTGDFDAAINYFQRAMEIQERLQGSSSPVVANILNLIGATYIDSRRLADAEPVLKRAIDIWERTKRLDLIEASRPLGNLATAYSMLNRKAEAEPLFERAIAFKRRAQGERHPDLIAPLNGIANIYYETGRAEKAIEILTYALAISDNVYGVNHPASVPVLTTLGSAYDWAGDKTRSEATYQRVLQLKRAALGDSHPSIALSLHSLAVLRANEGQFDDAIRYARSAVEITSLTIRDGQPETIARARKMFEDYIRMLDDARKKSTPTIDVAAEAFQVAQWINESTAASALNQLSARIDADNSDLARLVRAHQDALAEYRNVDAALIDSISSIASRNTAQDNAFRARMAFLAQNIRGSELRLQKEFPAYASLANEKPLAPSDVQKLLKDDEALVYFFPAETLLHIFAVTREGVDWATVSVGREKLTDQIRQFRHGLDIQEAQKSVALGDPDLFDLKRSNEMYDRLFSSSKLVSGKGHLIIVPTGPVTALPFNLLVTSPPDTSAAKLDPLAPFRTASWLVRQKAISILPSVGGLRATRVVTVKARAPKALTGYGDPIFGGSDDSRTSKFTSRAVNKRGMDAPFTDFWKGVGMERAEIATTLPRLEDSAEELKSISKRLNSTDSIQLGAAATETAIKTAPLADYRIVYFATHSLVAGDVNGIAEPSLALSIPANPTRLDDGLLTASEVAALSLNADWVVLSACNTASGGKPGAEALSGLARAFFYAGARSLLVTHWAVVSSAAASLTVSTFTALAESPKIGRAEALKRAMTKFIDDNGSEWNAYPAVWGPFVLIGANSFD